MSSGLSKQHINGLKNARGANSYLLVVVVMRYVKPHDTVALLICTCVCVCIIKIQQPGSRLSFQQSTKKNLNYFNPSIRQNLLKYKTGSKNICNLCRYIHYQFICVCL